MLLIDPRRHAISQSLGAIRFPFLFEKSARNLSAAKALLVRLHQGPALIRALVAELATHAGGARTGAARPTDVLELAAQAIANGKIQVGRQLQPAAKIHFNPEAAAQTVGFGTAIFLTEKIAKDFLTAAFKDPEDKRAFLRALTSPPDGVSVSGAGGDPISVLAPLLSRQRLVLVPLDASYRRVRLSWLKRVPPPEPETPVAAPPPRPSAPPPPAMPSAPASVLPEPPEVPSPQALALLDASKLGIPFCQECMAKALSLV